MLNADDPQTVYALRLLRETVQSGRKPVVIWVGAGASRWAGYPSWDDLARGLRLRFFKSVPGFENTSAARLIDSEEHPDFFQLCKNLESASYFRYLAEIFTPTNPNHPYIRLTELIQRLPVVQIVTTNVDEALERTMSSPLVLQNTDLTRTVELLNQKKPFIAKLHGSCSSIETAVFSTDDYARLLNAAGFVAAMKHIFTACSVLFLGYGVRDRYVVDLLSQHDKEMHLFGSGPHFMVTNQATIGVQGVQPIRYSTKLHPDHRAAMSVLDFLHESAQLAKLDATPLTRVADGERESQHQSLDHSTTAYFISDFKPPGTWHTSQTVEAGHGDETIKLTVGLGFTNDEIPFRTSTALHDLVVGLTCFDVVYLPVLAISALHDALGSALFWELANSESVKFVHSLHEPAVIFGEQIPEPFGNVVSITLRGADGTAPITALELIRRSVKPAPGREDEAEPLISGLEKRCVTLGEFEWQLPTEVRGALMMPFVSTLLGIGDAILPSQVPRWLTFPYLRMAHLVHTGIICASLGVKAAKVPFGGARLINGAFGVRTATEFAEQSASYVFSGNYNTDLGAMIQQDLRIFRLLLRFRQSQEGESFRREISAVLSVPLGTEFAASVDAGLRRSIPSAVLQKTKDRLSFLLTNHARTIATPAVWGNSIQSDRVTEFWRAKSLRLLLQLCESRGVSKNDPCICGSGEKLRLCCMHPLRP